MASPDICPSSSSVFMYATVLAPPPPLCRHHNTEAVDSAAAAAASQGGGTRTVHVQVQTRRAAGVRAAGWPTRGEGEGGSTLSIMALIPSQVLRVAILLSYFSILCHYKALDMPAHQTYGGSWKFLTFIDLVRFVSVKQVTRLSLVKQTDLAAADSVEVDRYLVIGDRSIGASVLRLPRCSRVWVLTQMDATLYPLYR